MEINNKAGAIKCSPMKMHWPSVFIWPIISSQWLWFISLYAVRQKLISQLTFQTCVYIVVLSITVDIKFESILSMMHYHHAVMRFKSRMIWFETSALHYIMLIMWLWQKIMADLELTVMDYTTQDSFECPLKGCHTKGKWRETKAGIYTFPKHSSRRLHSKYSCK